VRSIASEAARQATRYVKGEKQAPNLAFYTANLVEGLSAFDAGILSHQAAFVAKCLDWLTNHQSFIFVIGHSMGALL
jgi:hypothetical protein